MKTRAGKQPASTGFRYIFCKKGLLVKICLQIVVGLEGDVNKLKTDSFCKNKLKKP
jgi:hypothetical protein